MLLVRSQPSVTNYVFLLASNFNWLYNSLFWVFVSVFCALGWLDGQPVAEPYITLGLIYTILYFGLIGLLLYSLTSFSFPSKCRGVRLPEFPNTVGLTLLVAVIIPPASWKGDKVWYWLIEGEIDPLLFEQLWYQNNNTCYTTPDGVVLCPANSSSWTLQMFADYAALCARNGRFYIQEGSMIIDPQNPMPLKGWWEDYARMSASQYETGGRFWNDSVTFFLVDSHGNLPLDLVVVAVIVGVF